MGITEERLREIMNEDNKGNWDGDNAYKGLQIIAKYSEDLIGGAEHDIIYSAQVDEIIEKGITEEDVVALRNLNWMIDSDCDCLACFV